MCFRAVIDEYGKAVYALTLKLMAILSEEIGQPPDFIFSKVGGRKAGLRTYIINYPPCPQPDLAMGISKHSDISAISVLQQNNVSALEVERDGRWVAVPPDPHAFVINVGDSLQAIHSSFIPLYTFFCLICLDPMAFSYIFLQIGWIGGHVLMKCRRTVSLSMWLKG